MYPNVERIAQFGCNGWDIALDQLEVMMQDEANMQAE